MKLSIMEGVDPHVVDEFDVPWDEFLDEIENSHSGVCKEKKELLSFSPTHFKGAYRKKENAGLHSAIVVDLDEVHDGEAIKKALEHYDYVGWTTYSHTSDKPRWRLVIRLRDEVDHRVLARYVSWVDRTIGSYGKLDIKAMKDPARLWFLPGYPSKRAEKEFEMWFGNGKGLNLGKVITVDFTGVPNPNGIVSKGGRNEAVMNYVNQQAVRMDNLRGLLDIAEEYNDRHCRPPLSHKELRTIVSSAKRYVTENPEGIAKRGKMNQRHVDGPSIFNVARGFMDIMKGNAAIPVPLIGQLVFPGATLVSAKAKEGKSFLLMQLALSMASGHRFLKSPTFHGYAVERPGGVLFLACEDTDGELKMRFWEAIENGILPAPKKEFSIVTAQDLQNHRESFDEEVDGKWIFEQMIDEAYKRGVRLVVIDPLKAMQSYLKIGFRNSGNVHDVDFEMTRYYTQLAQRYEGLAIMMVMHHGKRKGQQGDTGLIDPMDAIASSSGTMAGVVGHFSLLPMPNHLKEEDGENKRRALHVYGRHFKEETLWMEQQENGIWECQGELLDTEVNESRVQYFEAMIELDGEKNYIQAAKLATAVGASQQGARQILSRIVRTRDVYMGFRIESKTGKGYILRAVQ